jgi:F420-non-reducing hydrogenase small subunit
MKMRLSAEWLSDCGGCHCGMIDLHETIFKLLDDVDLVHFPILTDTKDYPVADIGIVSGAIRNAHERRMAEQMRASCRVILGLGTCAVFGGISGAGGIHTREEIMDAVYLKNPTTGADGEPTEAPPLEKTVSPLDAAIDVDFYLPGCPPHPKYILEALLAILNKKDVVLDARSVCASCERRMIKRPDIKTMKGFGEGSPEAETCFLSEGILCLGSVTAERCLSPCPNNGIVCTGCGGPTVQIMREPNRDIRTELSERISLLTGINREDARETIERFSKTHYAYAMASPIIGGKPTFLIHQWLKEADERP